MVDFKTVFKDSVFYKNILTLLKGSVLAQFIPLIISPIITRLYSPRELGVLALFSSLSVILGSIVNGRYEQALVLVKSEDEARHLTILSLLISFVMSLLFLIVFILFKPFLLGFFNEPDLGYWIYCIPLVVFSIGVYNTLNYYELRKKNFISISKSEVYRSASFASIQLTFPYLKSGLVGLIMGKIISSIVAPFYLWKTSKFEVGKVNFSMLTILAKKYIDFPKFTNFSILLNNLSINTINLLIPTLYSTTLLGLYSLMYKVLAAPFAFLGNSINQVFLEEAVRQKNDTAEAFDLTKRMVLQLSLLSFLFFGVAYFIVEDLFAFIFGEEWKMSGLYAKYLIPFFMFKFIASPLTSIHTAFEKQKLSFTLQLIMFVISMGAILYAYIYSCSFEQYLLLFSVLMSIFYIFRIAIILRISKNKIA
ncbi:MAG: oligosaccharide flippase family protein [Flavobacteriales bacterium]|nr:oligosaccharide flippase family protein [Flavobacteriales bacterium]